MVRDGGKKAASFKLKSRKNARKKKEILQKRRKGEIEKSTHARKGEDVGPNQGPLAG